MTVVFKNRIALVKDFAGILKTKPFKNKYGRTISVETHGQEPAYMHLTAPLYTMSDLLPRCLDFLSRNKEVSEDMLRMKATQSKYPAEIINATMERLKQTEHIGYSKKVFIYYPPSPDGAFRQEAIDDF